MHIELDTERMSEHDALSLAVLIHSRFPAVLGQLSLMANASYLALAAGRAGADEPADPDKLAAEDAFAGGPPAIMPAAEDAFAPQSEGASLDTGQAGAGHSTSGADGDGGTTSTTATNDASHSDGPAVDSTGLPWDARIHSGGQAKTGEGKWKKKKGVGADTVAAIEAELRARMATAPLGGSTAGAPPPPESAALTSSTTPGTPAEGAAPAAATVPPAPPVPAAPAPPAPPASAPATTPTPPDAGPTTAETTFPPDAAAQALHAAATRSGAFSEGQAPAVMFATAMRKVTDGAFNPGELASACAAVGLTSPRELLQRSELIPEFLATLDDIAAARAPA